MAGLGLVILLFTGSDRFQHWKYRGFHVCQSPSWLFLSVSDYQPDDVTPHSSLHSILLTFSLSLCQPPTHSDSISSQVSPLARQWSWSYWQVTQWWTSDQWSVPVYEMTVERSHLPPSLQSPPTQDNTPLHSTVYCPRSERSELWSTTEPLSLSLSQQPVSSFSHWEVRRQQTALSVTAGLAMSLSLSIQKLLLLWYLVLE